MGGILSTAPHSTSSEIKTTDVPATTSGYFNDAAQYYLLNGLINGSGFYNRIGRKVSLKSVRVRGQIYPDNDTADGTSQYFRIIILYDKQPNQAFPPITDILATFNNAGAPTTTAYSFLNITNSDRFVILRDTPFHISDNALTGLYNQDANVMDYKNKGNYDEYIDLKNVETGYSNTSTGAIGDIQTGALYMVLYGTAPAATANENVYRFNFTARLRFWDR